MRELVLDTRGLLIHGVSLEAAGPVPGPSTTLDFKLGTAHPVGVWLEAGGREGMRGGEGRRVIHTCWFGAVGHGTAQHSMALHI